MLAALLYQEVLVVLLGLKHLVDLHPPSVPVVPIDQVVPAYLEIPLDH